MVKEPFSLNPTLTWVGYSNHKQFAENISHNLHCCLADHMGMTTDQVDGRCEQTRASAGCFHPDLLVFTVQKVVCTVPDKLSQRVAWKEEDGDFNTGLHLNYWSYQGRDA